MRDDIENPMLIDSLWRNRTHNDDYYADVFDKEELEVECNCCGKTILIEDAFPSEIWEDVYLCPEKECIEKHHTGWAESMKLQKYYINRKRLEEDE